jgi:hypothetical protein
LVKLVVEQSLEVVPDGLPMNVAEGALYIECRSGAAPKLPAARRR